MAHPSRAAQIQRLVAALGGVARAVLDPTPDAPPLTLRTAIAAWSARAADATHHLVLQDDAVPASGLLLAAEAAAAHLPHAALAFFAHASAWNGAATRLAVRCGRAWAEMIAPEYVPTVALLLPAAQADAFAVFARRQPPDLADDHAMAAFVRARRLSGYVAAPNLVEHDDSASLLGHGDRGPRRSPCAPASCGPHVKSAGILRLAGVPAIPLLTWGEPGALLPDRGRWGLAPWRQAAERLGLREARIGRAYERAVATLPGPVRGRFAGHRERLLTSLWIAAYLDGAVVTRLGGGPAEPHAARLATECLIQAGLADGEQDPACLTELGRFVDEGTAAGAGG
jgi:hypothetical protein